MPQWRVLQTIKLDGQMIRPSDVPLNHEFKPEEAAQLVADGILADYASSAPVPADPLAAVRESLRAAGYDEARIAETLAALAEQSPATPEVAPEVTQEVTQEDDAAEPTWATAKQIFTAGGREALAEHLKQVAPRLDGRTRNSFRFGLRSVAPDLVALLSAEE